MITPSSRDPSCDTWKAEQHVGIGPMFLNQLDLVLFCLYQDTLNTDTMVLFVINLFILLSNNSNTWKMILVTIYTIWVHFTVKNKTETRTEKNKKTKKTKKSKTEQNNNNKKNKKKTLKKNKKKQKNEGNF